MSDGDMQMVTRVTDSDSTNLAIGEPVILQMAMADLFGRTPIAALSVEYPAFGGEEELLEQLRKIHPDSHIVVTNGAKQALVAAMRAVEAEDRVTGVVHVNNCYWPSYPTLAKQIGLSWNSYYGPRATIVTSPNNPDGEQPQATADIWDAVYAEPLYGYRGNAPSHRISVHSAAKSLGLSGARVGWLVTKDKRLARLAAEYVEFSTTGVSTIAQSVVATALRTLSNPRFMVEAAESYMRARAMLMANGASFTELISDMTTTFHGVPRDGSGMFAWFKTKQPTRFQKALKAAKVLTVNGQHCGADSSYHRMSMGADPEVTRAALTRVRSEYLKLEDE